jgi:hypothetical protein
MSEISVRKVESTADFNVFFDFPWHLYKDSPFWVPPLKSDRRHTLDREHDASWQYMEGDYFVAWQGERPVGTIAAFVNHRHNQTWNENIAWFGAFDFVDDPAVAAALLQTAEAWGREHGYTALRGPATFTLHSEVGVLISPYDQTPLILMPYNYDYYPEHIEAAGYHVEKKLGTWTIDPRTFAQTPHVAARIEKSKRLAERTMARGKVTWRKGNPKNMREDFEVMYQIYNSGWADNWGFVPLTEQELRGLIDSLANIYNPNLAFYVFVEDEPAAFVVGVEDMNQAFHYAYPKPGEPEFFTLLKVLWHWKIRPKVNRVRFPLAGVSGKHQSTAVIAVGMWAFFETLVLHNPKWHLYDGGWVLEDNNDMNTMLRNLTVDEGRVYHIYQKSL